MKLLRKTILSVSALTATAITFASVTYAWFPGYSESKVNNINLSVNGGLGFLVSIDGINYKSDLTQEEIYGAMLVKNAPNEFAWQYNETLAKSELYTLTADPQFDEDNNLTGYTYTPDHKATESEIANALKQVELMPLTSKNGVGITDLYNSAATAESGRFIEFQVYFRTTSLIGQYDTATEITEGERYYQAIDYQYVEVSKLGLEVTNDNANQYYYKESADSTEYKTGLATYNSEYLWYKQLPIVKDVTENAQALLDNGEEVLKLTSGYRYEVYLNGDTETIDAQYLYGVKTQDAITISPTKFTSNSITGTVGADMMTVQNGVPTLLKGPSDTQQVGDSFTVYGGNALRMSITDENAFSASSGASGSLIYELNDSENGGSNFGSYATTYSETYCTDNGLTYSSELDYKYGYQYSASYTYYTNLKQSNALYNQLMAIDEIPTTISDLTSKDDEGNYLYNKKITTLSSGEDGKLITFRIWLEGWDADCFDGLGGTIQSQLSFSSKRIN